MNEVSMTIRSRDIGFWLNQPFFAKKVILAISVGFRHEMYETQIGKFIFRLKHSQSNQMVEKAIIKIYYSTS